MSKESKVQIGKSAYFELTIRCSIFTVNNNNNFEIVHYKFHRMFKCASQQNHTVGNWIQQLILLQKNNKNHHNNKTISTNTAY